MGAQIGDGVVEAGPGDVIRKPRGVPHAFWNARDEPARLIELVSPAGFEAYFAEMAPILNAGGGPPDVEAIGAVQARYGLSMDRTSIGRLAAVHGLQVA